MRHKRNKTAKDFPITGKGESGRNRCRVCHKEVPKNRRTLCSDACSEEIKIQTSSGYARYKVKLRDRGVCQLCGLDTVRLEKIVFKLCARDYKRRTGKKPYNAYESWHYFSRDRTGILKHLLDKYPWFKYYGHRWEADHIVPVCEGGEPKLDNLRTLCLGCHKAETKNLMSRRRKND